MSYLSAAFFTWVQGAQFYVDLHTQAIEQLPTGNGKSWLDVGCGPGLVARLARNRGYDVLGLDQDATMIRMAAHISRRDTHCRFEVGDLEHTSSQHSADVVSAASLLFILPDPTAALHQLWRCVRPHGYLLVIETTSLMTPELARQVSDTTPPGRRLALHLWAHARNGKAIAAKVYESLPSVSTLRTPLLHGIVATWMFKKGPA